jgi:hypothetical protein
MLPSDSLTAVLRLGTSLAYPVRGPDNLPRFTGATVHEGQYGRGSQRP